MTFFWRRLFIPLLSILLVSTLSATSVEEQVKEIAASLRCPVCQNLSVADSPSQMAEQMRGLIRERLQAGEHPEAVKAYFVERYGEWILLAPKGEGFNLVVWILPLLGMVGGAVGLLLVLRRWVKRHSTASLEIDPAYLERVRREMTKEHP